MDQTENTTPSFLWYDYETFGTDPKRDLPVQYGAIRTDGNFNQLGKTTLLYSQPSEDYLPDPYACLVTGITPLTVMDEGLKETEFAQLILNEMSKPETITVGFNSQGFDDEVTRFMFWRNLLPPYDREYGEGRGKLDMYLVVKALYAFHPESLKWLKNEKGEDSLRLEHISKANNLPHDHAHDALSDAKATMQLAKKISQVNPRFWNYVLNNLNAKGAQELISKREPLLYVNPFGSKEKRYINAIFPLIEDPRYAKNWICWNLEEDPAELDTISAEDIKERFYLTKEQKAAGVKPLPFISINLKKMPFLTKGLGWLDKGGKDLPFAPIEQIRRNAAALAGRNGEFTKLHGLFAELSESKREDQQAGDKNLDAETELYSGGFLTDADKYKLAKIRATNPNDLADNVITQGFGRKDLEDLVFRYRARNFSDETLTADEEKKWRRYRQEHLIKGKNGARTFDQFFETIEELRDKVGDNEAKQAVLDDLQAYGEGLAEDY